MAFAKPTLEKLRAAILEWENSASPRSSLKIFLKRKFPGLRQEHLATLVKDFRR